jgi:DtxR family Mn-dependent transcriptional regulator
VTETTSATESVSPAEGRHLCGLFAATLAGDTPVSTGSLADRLGVSGATVTETVQRLHDRGLTAYEPYTGTGLTSRGETVARQMLWRRCLVQDFFETTTDVSLSDETAYRIARAITREELSRFEERLARPCDGRCTASDRTDCDRL